MSTFTAFGKKSGFLINLTDLNFQPLSMARCTPAWIDGEGSIMGWDSTGEGDVVLIPYKQYINLCQEEKDGEIGRDLLLRVYKLKV